MKVERCVNLGESSKIKKGKKVAEALPDLVPTHQVNPKKQDTNKVPEDPEFAEFREIHSHNQKDKIWDNDGIDGTVQKPVSNEDVGESNEESVMEKIAHKKDLSDLEVCSVTVIF